MSLVYIYSQIQDAEYIPIKANDRFKGTTVF